MAICKLCKKDKILIKRSHIIPEFLYDELYDENHRLFKFNAIENANGIERISKPPKGEYEGGLLCKECDGDIIGKFESYLGKILNNSKIPEQQKPKCKKLIYENGKEFTILENIEYKSLKLCLLSILWRASISKRPLFKDVSLGLYEEKIRRQLLDENPSNDNDIAIIVLSWRNDNDIATDVIVQPRKIEENGKTYYSIVLNGYVILYYVSNDSIKKELEFFRLKKNNTLSIIHLPKGGGMNFMLNYIGVREVFRKNKQNNII